MTRYASIADPHAAPHPPVTATRSPPEGLSPRAWSPWRTWQQPPPPAAAWGKLCGFNPEPTTNVGSWGAPPIGLHPPRPALLCGPGRLAGVDRVRAVLRPDDHIILEDRLFVERRL